MPDKPQSNAPVQQPQQKPTDKADPRYRAEMPPAIIEDPSPLDDEASDKFAQMDDLSSMVQEFAPIPGVEKRSEAVDPTKDPLNLTDGEEPPAEEQAQKKETRETVPAADEFEEPGQPEQKQETPAVEEKEEQDESAEDTIARLRQTIVELSAGGVRQAHQEHKAEPSTIQGQSAVPTAQPQQAAPAQQPQQQQQPPAPQYVAQGDVIQFVKDAESFQQALSSPESFNKLMTGQSAYTVEQVIRAMTQLVPAMMQRQLTYFEATQEFLRENQELAPVKGYLMREVNLYSAAHPEENDILKIFNEAGAKTRRDLAIARKAAALNEGDPSGNGRKPQKKPVFAEPGGSRKGSPADTPARKGVQAEIDDLIS